MSQQINLFNPVFLKQKKHFSAVTMAQALGLITAGALAMYGFSAYQLASLNKEVKMTSSQLAAAQVQLDKAKGASASREKSQALEAEIMRTEAELQSLRQVFETLNKGELGNTQGYSEYMQAFARQIVPGTWLTGFRIHGAGSEIALRGRALQPESIPAYIGRLGHESVMHNKSFAVLHVDASKPEQSDSNKSAKTEPISFVEFVLHSAGIEHDSPTTPGSVKQ